MTKLIPVLSSPSGSCLTTENWQEAGVEIVSYTLSSLLMKPGYAVLNTLSNLAIYVGWPGVLVLNASDLLVNGDGLCTLRSHYDGSSMHYTLDELLSLIIRLQPQFVILPQGIQRYNSEAWWVLPESIFPFFSVLDYPIPTSQKPHGIYLNYDAASSSPELLKRQLTQYSGISIYVAGNFNGEIARILQDFGVQYIESDKPAYDACQGLIRHFDGNFLIQEPEQAMNFAVIDPNCHCSTCQQQFTRAYLHHLYEHTPLLCHRLLISHNQYQPFT